jgi:WD40 repeat protein
MRVNRSAVLVISGVMLMQHVGPAAPAAEIQPRVTLGSLGHGKPVVELVFSPDGKTLTSRDQDGEVLSRDFETGAVHMEPKIRGSRLFVLSADRRLSASVVLDRDQNNSVEIRDESRKQTLHRLQDPTWPRHDRYKHTVRCMAFNADGKLLVTGGAMNRFDDGDRNGPADAVRLWDVATGAETKSFDVGHAGVRSVAVSGDGKTLAAGTDDGVKVWDVDTGKERFNLRAAGAYNLSVPVVAIALAIGPAGRTLVAAWGRDVIAWDLAGGTEWRRETAHWVPVTAMAFSPNGRCFASGDALGDVRVWSIRDWVQAVTQPNPAGPRRYEPKRFGHEYGELTSVVTSADGKSFAFGGVSRAAEYRNYYGGSNYPPQQPGPATMPPAWTGDVATGVIKARFFDDQSTYRVERLALSPDGKTLAAYTGAGINLVDTATGAARKQESVPPEKSLAPHTLIHAIQFAPDGRSLLVSDGHCGVTEGQQKLVFPPALRVLDLATGRWAIAIAGQKGPGVEIEPGQELKLYFLGVYLFQDQTSLSRDGAFYAASADEESIGIWRTDTGALVSKLPGRFMLTRPMLSPDGRIVVVQGKHFDDPKSGEEHQLTSVWNVATGKLLARMPIGEIIDSRPAISLDNSTVALATKNRLHIWSAAGGAKEHGLTVSKPAFLPDNKTLVAIRENDLVLIDAATGKVRDSLVGHARPVIDYAITPDGKSLVSIGKDRTARIWDLPAAARGR